MKRPLMILVSTLLMSVLLLLPENAMAMNCWFPPAWKKKPAEVKAITDALSKKSGITIKPRIAGNYAQILDAFNSSDMNLVYVGSFIQAIIKARGLGTALVQAINGKEYYSGIMVYPKTGDPAAILKDFPEKIAFAKGASSGESSAKAATQGKADIMTANHGATCNAVKYNQAKAGFVKNWWWEANKTKYNMLSAYEVPGISIIKNPDNVLTASKAVPPDIQKKIKDAAIEISHVFGADKMAPFNPSQLNFSLELMKKGNIDPLTYTW